MTAHVHKHELEAEHFLASGMRMSADDIQLNDVEIIELFEGQPGEVMGWRAAERGRVGARRLDFRAIRWRE